MLGNLKFIGELGKLDMLHEGILHRCIQQLLEKKTKNESLQDMADDYECLCQIMRTIGRSLDHDKARLWMDQYFDRIMAVMVNTEFPQRIRFMLMDVVELRDNGWVPRKVLTDIGPKTIQQVRQDAVKEFGLQPVQPLTMNMDPFGRPMNGTASPHKSTMGDIFGPASPPYMGSSSIGTGPGVVDDFTPSFLSGNHNKSSPFDGFSSGFSNRGKPNDRRGGHNSPRFDRYNQPQQQQQPQYQQKEADNDSDEEFTPRDRGNQRDYIPYTNNRYNRSENQPPRYNRNQQNLTTNFRGGQDRERDRERAPAPRQRSPYQHDDDRAKDNRTPESDNWRKDREPEEKPREKRAYRPGIDDMDRAPKPRPGDRKDDIRVGDKEGYRKEDRGFGSRDDLRSGSWRDEERNSRSPRNDHETRTSFNRNDNDRGYVNGDAQDRTDRNQDDHNQDFNRDFRKGFRDDRGFRDRDLGDNRGFGNDRFGDRDQQRGGYQFHRGEQRGGGQAGASRELPPRFQKKQQPPPQSDLFSSELPATPPSPPAAQPAHIPPGAPPQRYRHPLAPAQHPAMPGFYPHRFPPPGAPPMRGPPPQGYPQQPMPHPHFLDGPRESPGGPDYSPPQNLPKGPATKDQISLRPARNFPTLLRPSAPSMLPKSAQNPCLGPTALHQLQQQQNAMPDLLGPGPGGPQGMKTTNLTIKQAPERKDKKKANRDELKQATEELLKNFLETGNIEEAVTVVKDLKPPRRFMPEMISMMITQGLEKGDAERDNINLLIQSMKQEGVLSSDLYMSALAMVMERMADLEQEIPLVKSNVAKFAAQAVGSSMISLGDLAEPLQNGNHYPFFLLCLQQLHKVKDKDWLAQKFEDSKIELLTMLPECERTKERMVEILEDRGLSFMFPLLRVQSDIWRQIRTDPNPTNLYKWIKENVDSNLQADAGFIEILVTSILKYVVNESTLKDGADGNNPEKAVIDKEKDLLEKFKGVLQRFLLDNGRLQMTAIYAIQVLGYSRSFPKGMMLRMFVNMYDLEVIDEDTFLKWKEEVNDEYPGKGQVLFQVHQWLTWLEQAEEEESDDDN